HYSPTSKDIRNFQKRKEERDKALFSEHHNMRISQALSLMNEILSESAMSPANDHKALSSAVSSRAHRRRHMASSKGGHLNSPIVPQRSRQLHKGAAKPSVDRTVRHSTPALGFTQSRGKNFLD
ncbi:CPLN1 protein, partial [Neodrepanis coruscans]|nr:CPLN1 protein [Neodrepanis coruscans]